MEQVKIENVIFIFFMLGCSGWVLETINESITRRKFVNKGFFNGPFTLSHGIGGLVVYAIGYPFRVYPPLVFGAGLLLCTAIEYIMAIFLEKCFKVKCWDYTTYPHTKWCTYKGRICLTISLFFGLITLFVVYLYWDFGMGLANRIGPYIWLVDGILLGLFLVDAVYTCAKYIRYKKAGIKSKSYAVFSDAAEIK
jgi:uncharacterized membrane protein